MTHKKKLLIYNYLFFSVLLLLYMAVTLFLFHRQSVSYDGKYASDIHPYIAEMQGIDSGYDFPYPILFLTGRFFRSSPRLTMLWHLPLRFLTPSQLLF